MSRVGLTLLLSVWLALGVGGKLLRYAPSHEAAAHRTEQLVRAFLEARGWTFVDRKPITTAGLYAAQSFSKPGCARALQVVVLGASSEASDVVLAALGADAAFMNDGQFSARPAATAFAAQVLQAGIQPYRRSGHGSHRRRSGPQRAQSLVLRAANSRRMGQDRRG